MAPSKPLPTSMVAWQNTPGLFSRVPFEIGLKLNQIAAVPTLKKSQTLVKILTAGINPVDYKLGELPIVAKLALGSTSTPGMDYVGRVWSTTLPEDAGIKAGDLVYGKTEVAQTHGTLASFAVIAGAEGVVKVPANVPDIDWLATLGVTATTAYQSIVPALEDKGPGSAQGKAVLINGASGGVGTFTVQIAKALGCEHIVATCSAANADLVKGLGATEVIDYRSTDVADAAKSYVANKLGGKKFDAVVDNAGADMSLYYRAHEYLAENKNYVLVGAGMSLKAMRELTTVMLLPSFLGGGKRKFEFLGAATKKADFERIAGWIAAGKIKPVIDSTFEMSQAKEAYKKLKTGRARGNILVRVSEDGRGES